MGGGEAHGAGISAHQTERDNGRVTDEDGVRPGHGEDMRGPSLGESAGSSTAGGREKSSTCCPGARKEREEMGSLV
jgi:hypothetical protein